MKLFRVEKVTNSLDGDDGTEVSLLMLIKPLDSGCSSFCNLCKYIVEYRRFFKILG